MRTVSDGLMIVYWYVTSNTKLLFMKVQCCKHIIWYVPVSNRLSLIWNRLPISLIVFFFCFRRMYTFYMGGFYLTDVSGFFLHSLALSARGTSKNPKHGKGGMDEEV